MVRAQNSDLKAAQGQVDSSEALVGQARSGFFPKLNGVLSGSRGGNSTSASTTYAATLNGSQNVFNGLADAARTSQASLAVDISQARQQTTLAQVSYQLKTSFENLLYSQEFVKLAQDILERRKANLKLVDLRYQTGAENGGSLMLSRAYLAQAQYDLLVAQDSTPASRLALARVLGRDEKESSDLEAVGAVPTHDEAKRPADFWATLGEHPDHRVAMGQQESADYAITAARAGFLPSLNLSGTLGRQDSVFFPKQSYWSTTVAVSVPIFNGLSDLSALRSSAALAMVAAENRAGVDRSLVTQLTASYNAYVESMAKLSADTAFRDAAQTRAEIARKKYGSGLLSFDDWDIIENDLINRQKSWLQSKRDRVTAEAAWEQSQGKGIL